MAKDTTPLSMTEEEAAEAQAKLDAYNQEQAAKAEAERRAPYEELIAFIEDGTYERIRQAHLKLSQTLPFGDIQRMVIENAVQAINGVETQLRNRFTIKTPE